MANSKISELPVLQKLGNTGAAPNAARSWDFAYTWNAAGTAFTADFMNVTNTASAAGSLLIDRQIGGSSIFAVHKSGDIYARGSANCILFPFNGTFAFSASTLSSAATIYHDGTDTLVCSDGGWGWTNSASNATTTVDTKVTRHSAGVAKVTDGTSANVRYLMGGGAAVASAAALPLPTGSVFHVTGTTSITSITSTNFQSGVTITLIFDGILTVTDGGNLKLAGNFVTTADDTLTLAYDGTTWYEVCRSVN